ncbi:hypothetical protein [Candidatus Poriferisodalis sp.]
MVTVVGNFVVVGVGVALFMAGLLWWAAAALFVGLLGVNALSRR